MFRTAFFAAVFIVFSLSLSLSCVYADMSADQVRKVISAALHHSDPAVKAAAAYIQSKGLLKPGVSKEQIMSALKDKSVRAAIELLMAKGILPKYPLPKASVTLSVEEMRTIVLKAVKKDG